VAFATGAEAIQADMQALLEKFDLTPPELLQDDNIELAEVFRWLRAYMAMADSGSHFFGNLSEAVVAHTLSAAVCGLLPAKAGSFGATTEIQLRTLHDKTFQWPSLESMRPEALPVLSKNIMKNFVETFFQERGCGLVSLEATRLKEHVSSCSSHVFEPLRFRLLIVFLF
jgi:hypothetical protein